jgi:L-alanine-DL-glutamate epimerase-like enolase superfamily enzyme
LEWVEVHRVPLLVCAHCPDQSAMDKTGFDLYTYMLNPDFLAIKDGHVSLFDRPGLGVDIDEAKVRQEAGKAIPFKNDVVRVVTVREV